MKSNDELHYAGRKMALCVQHARMFRRWCWDVREGLTRREIRIHRDLSRESMADARRWRERFRAAAAGQRLYHLEAVNERTGRVMRCTGYPMPHDDSCVMLRKQTPHGDIRYRLRQI